MMMEKPTREDVIRWVEGAVRTFNTGQQSSQSVKTCFVKVGQCPFSDPAEVETRLRDHLLKISAEKGTVAVDSCNHFLDLHQPEFAPPLPRSHAVESDDIQQHAQVVVLTYGAALASRKRKAVQQQKRLIKKSASKQASDLAAALAAVAASANAAAAAAAPVAGAAAFAAAAAAQHAAVAAAAAQAGAAAALAAAAPVGKRRGRPVGSKNKPKPPAPVDPAAEGPQ